MVKIFLLQQNGGKILLEGLGGGALLVQGGDDSNTPWRIQQAMVYTAGAAKTATYVAGANVAEVTEDAGS